MKISQNSRINIAICLGLLVIALFIRLLYFPDNVYFSYDQARDSFTSLELMRGDLKLVGPPSAASDQLFPGPLIYYLHGPVLNLSNGDPAALSLFLRTFNALGAILVFLIGLIIFNRFIAISTALFYAVNYEQTQYTLFLCHQGYSPVTVLIFYLGLALVLFKKKSWGLIIAALGLGLSIQFHYSYSLLMLGLMLIALLWKNQLQNIKIKYYFYASLVFLLAISSFIITEIKFHFNPTSFAQAHSSSLYFKETLFIAERFLHDNFLANYSLVLIPAIVLISGLLILYFKDSRQKAIFLLIWFLGGLPTYFLSGVDSYFYSGSAAVSLLFIASFLIYLLSKKQILIAIFLITSIMVNNLYLIRIDNIKGPNRFVIIQPELLLTEELKALDYIYASSKNQPFAISAITIPLNVNTLWSYLFEWYGEKKYHYLPVWGGDAAPGFPGNLKIVRARSELPVNQYLIIEPIVGLRAGYFEKLMREEGYFTKLVEEKKFGAIIVQKRQKY